MAGDMEDAAVKKMFDLYNEMIVTKEIPATAKVYGNMIYGCGRIGDIETATEILYLSDLNKIKRNNYIYNRYIQAIAHTIRKRKIDEFPNNFEFCVCVCV